MQQCRIFWYLFDSFTRELESTDVVLGYLPLDATGERLGNKEALFDFSDRSGIWDFADTAIVLY